MRASLRALIAALTCAPGCTSKPASEPSDPVEPAKAVSASAPRERGRERPYPRVEINFTDHTADEGAWSTTTLRVDGSFASEFEMSNGGATSTVTQCEGRIDPKKAENWIARMQVDATMATEPDVPGFGEALERGIEGSYRLQHFEDAGTSAWLDPARWDEARLAPLFERMKASERCTTFTR